jgi:hypothetical protein
MSPSDRTIDLRLPRRKSIVRDRGPVAEAEPKVTVCRFEPPPRPTRPRPHPIISGKPGRRKGGLSAEVAELAWAQGVPSGPCPTMARLGGTLSGPGPTVQGPPNTTLGHRPGPPGQWRGPRRALQVEATGWQHVVRRQTSALAGPSLRDRELSGNLMQSRVKNERCNLNILNPRVYPHYKRNHVPCDARTSSYSLCNSQE